MNVNLKNNFPLVSIVIPVYNREQYIGAAIESAVNQTYRNIEIIIVDNCSTDSTWDILNKWVNKDQRIRIFQNKTNIGPVLNWNECFKNAVGEYIKILWSDDWISIDFVEKAMCVFDDSTAFVLSGYQITTGSKVISETIYRKNKYSISEYLNNILLYNREKFPVSPGCAMFRTKDIVYSFVINIPNEDNLDSKKNGAGNDLLLFLNTAMRYTFISALPGIDSFFRSHEESFTISNKLDLYYEWAKVYFIQMFLSRTLFECAKKVQLAKRSVIDKRYKNIINALSFNKCMIKGFLYLIKCRL